MKRIIPLLCAAFLVACCVAGFVTPASALTAPDTNPPPDGWYAVCVIMNGSEVFIRFMETPLQSVHWNEQSIDFDFGDGLVTWFNMVSPADYTITSGDITSTDYGNLRFYDGEYVSDIGHVWYFYVNSVAAVEPPTTEPEDPDPSIPGTDSPSSGNYYELYALFQDVIYGSDAELTSDQTLTLTMLSTVACLFVVCLPFLVLWKILMLL